MLAVKSNIWNVAAIFVQWYMSNVCTVLLAEYLEVSNFICGTYTSIYSTYINVKYLSYMPNNYANIITIM